MKKFFLVMLICGFTLVAGAAGLLILRQASPVAYKKLTERAELAYVSIRNAQIDKKTDDIVRLQNLVAHAGGGVGNRTYLNSLEALDLNYGKGFRFFELDFEWTSDGYLVLMHDWGPSVSRNFNAGEHCYTLEEFKALKMVNGMTNLSLDNLATWIKKHPDAFIITDIKRDNIRALAGIKEKYPELVGNFIPQIYRFREYFPARNLGYDNIILTLYVAQYSDESVLEFAGKYPLAAVTIAAGRARTDLPQKLKDAGIPVYAHTVNDAADRQKLSSGGVFGVYTDFLVPGNKDEK